jgi:carboxymethylenebutenolidase
MAVMEVIEASFPRGTCAVHAFGAIGRSSTPVVLFFPDAFGQRPSSHALAEELAAEGWRVLMPDYFYEHAPYEPLTPNSIFQEGPDRERVMAMFQSVTPDKIDADTHALLALADEKCGSAAPIAATGYCMGGRYALAAVCDNPRVRFAAAIHAANVAPAEGDGPHKRFANAKGRIYIGPSGIDPMYDAAEHGRVAEALRAADTDHIIENYKGVAHGFVYSDLPVYDEAASRKHMRRLKENMHELFAG